MKDSNGMPISESDKIAQEHPADIADQLERLDPAEAQRNFLDLSTETGAAVLSEVDEEVRGTFLQGIEPAKLAGLLRELPHDQAADVISHLDPAARLAIRNPQPSVPETSPSSRRHPFRLRKNEKRPVSFFSPAKHVKRHVR
jgi:flagellar motor switch protein FliG